MLVLFDQKKHLDGPVPESKKASKSALAAGGIETKGYRDTVNPMNQQRSSENYLSAS